MALVARPGLSLFARIREEPSAPLASSPASALDCEMGDHRFEISDRMGVPVLWRCNCGVYSFVKRKGHGLRNGRFVVYKCSTSKCRKDAKIRSRGRGAGGSYVWACSPEHAKGAGFVGRH